MSSANLDLVRSIYAAFQRGDFSSTEWAHPEIEFVLADGPDPGSWTGIAAMAKAWRGGISIFEDSRLEVNEYRELDDERVLVLVIFHGRGKTSGLEIGSQVLTKAANLLHLRNGKVTRLAIYNDRERALADLGLFGDRFSTHVVRLLTSREREQRIRLTDRAHSQEQGQGAILPLRCRRKTWRSCEPPSRRGTPGAWTPFVLLAPDAIMRMPDDWPEPGPFVGRDAVMRQGEQLRNTWDADSAEPISDFIDFADHVVVRFIWRTAGRGPESNMEFTIAYTLRKGGIFLMEYFWDHTEALETLGCPSKTLIGEPPLADYRK